MSILCLLLLGPAVAQPWQDGTVPRLAQAGPLDEPSLKAAMSWGQEAMERLSAAAPLALLAARTGNYEPSMRVLENAVPGIRETFTVEWSGEKVRNAEKLLQQTLGTAMEVDARKLLESSRNLQFAIVQQQVTPLLYSVSVLYATGHYTPAIALGEKSLKDLEKEGLLERLAEEEFLFRFFMVRSAIEGGHPEVFARHIGRALELAKSQATPGDVLTLETYRVDSAFALSPDLEDYKRERDRLWTRLIEADPQTVDRRSIAFWPLANRTLAASYSPESAERKWLDQRFEQDLVQARNRADKAWSAPLDLSKWNPAPYFGLLDFYLDLAGMARRAGDFKDARTYLSWVEKSLPELEVKADQVNRLAQPPFLSFKIEFDASKGHFQRLPGRYHEELGRLRLAQQELSSRELGLVVKDLRKATELYERCASTGPNQELKPLILLLQVRCGEYEARRGLAELNAWFKDSRKTLNRSALISFHLAAGEMNALAGDLAGASRDLNQGLLEYERLVGDVGPRAMASERLREATMRAYDLLFEAWQKQGATAQAMAALDRKSQVQAIFAVDVTASKSKDSETQLKLEAIANSRQRIQGLEQEADRVGPRQQGAKEALVQARQEFARAAQAVKGSSYARYLSITPPELSRIQKALPADVAIVQPAFRESGMVILVATRDELTAYNVASNLEELRSLVGLYRREILSNPSPEVDWSSAGQQKLLQTSYQLHRILLEPIESSLAGKTTIAFVPAGPLYYLPFQSLAKKDEQGRPNFLIERFQVVTLCKPSDLENLTRVGSSQTEKLAAFGNPDSSLPDAEQEVTDLAKLYPEALTFVREKASKKRLMSLQANAGLLHLATHGVLNLRNPRFSYLVLAGSGPEARLTFSDIAGLALKNNHLVTLSACDTALGEGDPGGKNAVTQGTRAEPFLVSSLAEAFSAAGSPTVLASLWQVDDRATRVLMSRFYGGLKGGLTKGSAMQKSQIAMVRDGPYGHPYYWSPFVLWGDWR